MTSFAVGRLLITREEPGMLGASACWVGSYGRHVCRDESLLRLLWRMARRWLRVDDAQREWERA